MRVLLGQVMGVAIEGIGKDIAAKGGDFVTKLFEAGDVARVILGSVILGSVILSGVIRGGVVLGGALWGCLGVWGVVIRGVLILGWKEAGKIFVGWVLGVLGRAAIKGSGILVRRGNGTNVHYGR